MAEITPHNPIIPVHFEGGEGWIRFALPTEEEPRWRSSNPEVATIDTRGKATARSPGTTRIEASSSGASTHLTVVEGEYDYQDGQDMLIVSPDGSLFLLAKNAWTCDTGQVTRIEHYPDFVERLVEEGDLGVFEPVARGDVAAYLTCYVLNLAHLAPQAR